MMHYSNIQRFIVGAGLAVPGIQGLHMNAAVGAGDFVDVDARETFLRNDGNAETEQGQPLLALVEKLCDRPEDDQQPYVYIAKYHNELQQINLALRGWDDHAPNPFTAHNGEKDFFEILKCRTEGSRGQPARDPNFFQDLWQQSRTSSRGAALMFAPLRQLIYWQWKLKQGSHPLFTDNTAELEDLKIAIREIRDCFGEKSGRWGIPEEQLVDDILNNLLLPELRNQD